MCKIMQMVYKHSVMQSYFMVVSSIGPPPISPIVTYNESNNTLCAESKSEKWSPVIRAEVTVHDVTGDIIFDRVIPKSNFCLSLGMFPQICAPFNVSITASSQCTDSIPKIFLGE